MFRALRLLTPVVESMGLVILCCIFTLSHPLQAGVLVLQPDRPRWGEEVEKCVNILHE